MDLGQVKRKLESGKYASIDEAAEGVRLIWKNCMQYNADGSDFFILAQNMSKKFEEKYAKLQKDLDSSMGGSGGDKGGGKDGGRNTAEPTLEEKRMFAKLLYKITKEELGRVIVDLDAKCPSALTKNSAEDEVEINVDHISPGIFHELMWFVKGCANSGGTGTGASGGGNGGKKKKTAGGRPGKKARTST